MDDKQGPDFLLDTAKIQASLDKRKESSLRASTMQLRVPSDATPAQIEQAAQEAIGKWVNWMSKDGYELRSDMQWNGPLPLRDETTGAVILGQKTYHIKATFQSMKSTSPVRIELNPAVVKRDPEHRLTLHEARKAWGLPLPQPRRK